MGVPSEVGYGLSRGLGLELWNEGFIAGDETVEEDKDERLKVQRHLALGTKKKSTIKSKHTESFAFSEIVVRNSLLYVYVEGYLCLCVIFSYNLHTPNHRIQIHYCTLRAIRVIYDTEVFNFKKLIMFYHISCGPCGAVGDLEPRKGPM